MSVSDRLLRVMFALFSILGFGAQFSAAASKTPTTWWPDPTTGLMWAGQTSSIGLRTGIDWKTANDYCAASQLGGYTGWRLPTLKEVQDTTTPHQVKAEQLWDTELSFHFHPTYSPGQFIPSHEEPGIKGGIAIPNHHSIWTSTLTDGNKAWTFDPGYFAIMRVDMRYAAGSGPYNALCVRPMETDLLQIAKEAQVSHPVSNLQTLKDYATLSKARLAYQAGQFQDSITQAKNALLLKPDFAPAYWAIGISYGRLGQWDLAIINLQAALKIDKGYQDAKNALKWAEEGLKAAKSGGIPKAQAPDWN